MIRVECNDGMTQMMVEGKGSTILAESLCVVSSLYRHFEEHGVGDVFKAELLVNIFSGKLFDPDVVIGEDVTNLDDDEKLAVYERIKALHDKLRD